MKKEWVTHGWSPPPAPTPAGSQAPPPTTPSSPLAWPRHAATAAAGTATQARHVDESLNRKQPRTAGEAAGALRHKPRRIAIRIAANRGRRAVALPVLRDSDKTT